MPVLDVIERLKERVPALQNRVEGAAHLAALMAQNQLPQHTPAANVISAGLAGGTADAATGLFRQRFDETVSVILSFRNMPGTGERAIDAYLPVRRAVLDALCGWAPNDEVGVFRLASGRVVNMTAGTLVYQIDFAIGDQLRITVT